MYLETDRLIIRDWQPMQDARHALDIYGDEQVTQWLANAEPEQSIHAVQGRLQRYVSRTLSEGTGVWTVVEKAIDHIVGTILLVPLPNRENEPTDDIEIGWHFRPASWGYGYATEAAQRIVQYGFEELKLPMIYAVTLPENARSIAVMARLGMTSMGITTNYYGGNELLLYRLMPDLN
ncbi:MAG: GNAT family N-acetyltransferase [Cyanobacteria bacterium P01_D01_bin.44]